MDMNISNFFKCIYICMYVFIFVYSFVKWVFIYIVITSCVKRYGDSLMVMLPLSGSDHQMISEIKLASYYSSLSLSHTHTLHPSIYVYVHTHTYIYIYI